MLKNLKSSGKLPTVKFLDGITTDRTKCKIMEYSYSFNIDKTACSIVYIVNLNQCFSYTTTNFLLLSPDSKLYLVICIVVCVFMAMYIAKLNYRPIESTIGNIPTGYKNGTNEFYNISSYLKEKERDERQFPLKIKNYAKMLTSIGVEHILYNCIDSDELTELRMRYDIYFKYECYFVVLFETNLMSKSDMEPDEIYSISDVGIIVNTVLADIIDTGKYYCTDYSKGITCIVNIDKSDFEDVSKKIIEAGRIIENKMHLKLDIVISDLCYSIEDMCGMIGLQECCRYRPYICVERL